jgi:hypothetical protein
MRGSGVTSGAGVPGDIVLDQQPESATETPISMEPAAGGQTRPSAYYLRDDIQSFPAAPYYEGTSVPTSPDVPHPTVPYYSADPAGPFAEVPKVPASPADPSAGIRYVPVPVQSVPPVPTYSLLEPWVRADSQRIVEFEMTLLSFDREKAKAAGTGTRVWRDAKAAEKGVRLGTRKVLGGEASSAMVDEFLKRLKESGAATVLFSQKVRTFSGRDAEVEDVTEQPVVVLRQTVNGRSRDRIDVLRSGSVVIVTPVVSGSDGDRIQLKLFAEHSELESLVDRQTADKQGRRATDFVRKVRELKGSVQVPSGATIVVSDAASGGGEPQKPGADAESAEPGLMLVVKPRVVAAEAEESETIASVVIEGNDAIPTAAIVDRAGIPPKSPTSPEQVRELVRSLIATQWFKMVEPKLVRRSDGGAVLILHVTERPHEPVGPQEAIERTYVVDEPAGARDTVRKLRRDVHELRRDVKRLIELLEKKDATPAAPLAPAPRYLEDNVPSSKQGVTPAGGSAPVAPARSDADGAANHPRTWDELKTQRARARTEKQGIERLLDQKTVSLTFEQGTLRDAMKAVSEAAGVNVVVEDVVLEEVGVTLQRPVSLRLDKVSARTALRLLLEPLSLGWRIEADDVLVITNKIRLGGRLTVATYRVADLTLAPPPPLVAGEEESETSLGLDMETLKRLILTTIEPDSWNVNGGHGSIEPFEGTQSLVIRQTKRTHEEIADLLGQLRRLQDLQVQIESRLISDVPQPMWNHLRKNDTTRSVLDRLAEHGNCAVLSNEEHTVLIKSF